MAQPIGTVTDSITRPKLTDEQRNNALLALLRTDNAAIANALRFFAKEMECAAVEARKGYEAGQHDPDVKASQDRTLLTNNGLRQSMLMFEQQAKGTQRLADQIEWLCDDFAHDDTDDD